MSFASEPLLYFYLTLAIVAIGVGALAFAMRDGSSDHRKQS